MKKLKFLTVALAALTIVSCSKESESTITDFGKPSNITISLVGQEMATRGAGASGIADNTINDFAVLVFNGTGQLVASKAASSAEPMTILSVPGSASDVYVVANTGVTDIATGIFSTVEDMTSLKSVTGDLKATDATSTQLNTNLYMYGQGKLSAATPAGDTRTVAVTLAFSAAKINVVVTDARSGNEMYDYTDTKVVVLQAGGKTSFFGDNSTQSLFYTGATSGDYLNPATATTFAPLSEIAATDAKNDATGAYHFYVFGNEIDAYSIAEKTPTIIAVSSMKKLKSGLGKAERIYYPVHFSTLESVTNASGTWGPVKAGTHYTINIKLSKDADGGVDPEVPVVSSSVEVTVTTASWNTVTADKEF